MYDKRNRRGGFPANIEQACRRKRIEFSWELSEIQSRFGDPPESLETHEISRRIDEKDLDSL